MSYGEQEMRRFDQYFFVHWYETNGRDFPWRKEGVSPFALMITEMLLRQTQAVSVAKIWNDFVSAYPEAGALASAGRSEILEYLQVLGLGEQRTTALISAAKWLILKHRGLVPNNLEELLKVPHIGHYSARAILCFAFGNLIEIVDVNILRFFSRYYGIDAKPDIRRNPRIWELARLALPVDSNKAKQHNYGLIDFTSAICRSRNPRCNECDLSPACKRFIQRSSLNGTLLS